MNERALKIMADLNNKYKEPVIMSAAELPKIKRIPLDVPALDYCMGGGVPLNRMIEFFGGESSCKTWAAMLAIKEFQSYDWNNHVVRGLEEIGSYKEKVVKLKDGSTVITYIPQGVKAKHKNHKMKNVVLIDVENTYDTVWGEMLGIDNKRLIHVIPRTGEQAVDIAEVYLRDPETALVVFDSVAVAKSAAEIEKSMEDQIMGNQARFWNRAAAKFQAALNNNPSKDTTLIFINRAYMKVGLVFGNPEEIANGSGLKFAKSVSIRFQAMRETKENIEGIDVVTSRNINLKTIKNKTAKPFRTGSFTFVLYDDPDTGLTYGQTDRVNDLIELGVLTKVISKEGSNYKYKRWSARGRDNFENLLRKNTSIVSNLTTTIMEL